jgi:hypothetical protein
MKTEYAQRNRTGITPPTKEEFALAQSRGFRSISGKQLAEMRAEARTSRRVNLRTAATTTSASTQSDSMTIKKLGREVERLRQENTSLKIKIMTGK